MTKDEAIKHLREGLPPGATVYCALKHVSRSGMMREISLHSVESGEIRWLTGLAATALDMKVGKNEGIRIGGCGMDMGFALVYELAYALYPAGYGCIGKGCPSNDHSNGDRDYTPHEDHAQGNAEHICAKHPETCKAKAHWHNSGAYALRHRWL